MNYKGIDFKDGNGFEFELYVGVEFINPDEDSGIIEKPNLKLSRR